jgi:large subunit ribosomal protein L18
MSRIGKKPIPIPKGVTVKVDRPVVDVKGPKGKMRQAMPPGVAIRDGEDGELVARQSEAREFGKFHGLARSLVANAVHGVAEGWKRELDIVGVGYRAEVKGKQVVLALGYSHPVVFDVPPGDRDRGREADPHHGDGDRPAARRAGGRQPPPPAQARPVPAEGRALHGRSAEEEGGQDGSLISECSRPMWSARAGDGSERMKVTTRNERRQRIKYRIRKRIAGTAARPRLSVFRSVSHIYVQVIDDLAGATMAAASSVEPALKAQMSGEARGGNSEGRRALVGRTIAERLKEKGVTRVVFDRNGFLYHGRVRAVAEAARKAGSSSSEAGVAAGSAGSLGPSHDVAKWKAMMRTREKIDAVAARHQGHGRLHQPRDQGRQGRQEPELQRAGRRRRRPRRGRASASARPRKCRRPSRRASRRPRRT